MKSEVSAHMPLLVHSMEWTTLGSKARNSASGGVSSGHGDGNMKKKRQCNWWCAACGGPVGVEGPEQRHRYMDKGRGNQRKRHEERCDMFKKVGKAFGPF